MPIFRKHVFNMKELYQPPKGTKDYYPKDMKRLQKVIEVIRQTFEKYGFQALDTPAFENFDLLAAKGGLGEAVKDEIYYFKDKSGRPLGLRFDLTMPLARFIINNPELPKPFRRYQIGKVWRYDNPQALRFREFWQADIDIIGSSSMLADAECVACFVECLLKLGFKEISIRINNRKLLESLLVSNNVQKDKINSVFKIIDKSSKISWEEIKAELDKLKVDSKKILNAIKTPIKIERIEEIVGIGEGTNELKELFRYAKIFGIDKYLKIDLSVVRGLDYYTGPVFEIQIGKNNVSCGGGGRYDNLTYMIGGPELPATGFSLGIDRIIGAMDELEMSQEDTEKRFFVAYLENVKEDALKICRDLRLKGFICETDLMDRKLNKQLEYANSLDYPFVIIVGKEELRKEMIRLRDMKTGKEKLIALRNAAEELKRI
jgi:histidyl-tRNA synthetase